MPSATPGPAPHVLFTRALLDAPDRLVEVLVLSPVGVRPDLHGQGIGTTLISEALRQIALQRQEPAIFLEGNPKYYARSGFESAMRDWFSPPSLRTPEPAFQVLRLPPFDGTVSGTLVYPDAFLAHRLRRIEIAPKRHQIRGRRCDYRVLGLGRSRTPGPAWTGESVRVPGGEFAEPLGDRVDGRLAGGDVDHEVVDVVVAGA